MSTINNLVEKLNSSWVEELKSADPEVFLMEKFLVRGIDLKANVQCQARECLFENRSRKRRFGTGETYEVEAPDGSKAMKARTVLFIFCFACNKIGHAVCMKLSEAELNTANRESPWICPECTSCPKNPNAVRFYESEDWMSTILDRGNEFRRSECKIVKPISIDADETAIDEGSRLSVIKELTDKCQFEMNERIKLEVRLKQQEEELAKLRSKVESRKSHVHFEQEEFVSSSPKRTSYVQKELFEEYLNHSHDNKGNQGSNSRKPSANDDIEGNADVPLRSKRKSFIETIDPNDLSKSEKLILEQVQASIESTQAQLAISQNVNLQTIRKALPAITKFNGDTSKWIQFKQDIERYRIVGQYDEIALKLHIRSALEGTALLRVRDIIDTTPLSRVMKLLEDSFGEPTRIIERMSEDILAIRLNKSLFKDDVMLVLTRIQAYFEACKNARVGYANTHQLARHIFDQLNLTYKMMFRTQQRTSHPEGTKLVDLESLYVFLEDLYHDLEAKRTEQRRSEDRAPKSQTLSVSVASHNTNQLMNQTRNDFYEIRDKNQSQYGYEMSELAKVAKRCACCGFSNHYTIQCRKFRRMQPKQRMNLIYEKRLCRCCIVSSDHTASDCNIRNGCGFIVNGQVCGMKHHICLHRTLSASPGSSASGGYRSGRRNDRNNRRAENIAAQNNAVSEQSNSESIVEQTIKSAPSIKQVPTSQTSSQSSFQNPNIVKQMNKAFQSNSIGICASINSTRKCDKLANADSKLALTLCASELQRTVKVFKNYFIGNDKTMIGYSVGDSAAEVTLMRDDLRKQLNLKGAKCSLTMQYADGTVRTIPAKRVCLKLKGVHRNAEVIVLNNVYAIAELNLPSRSLDMEALKSQFPYLKPIKFESYRDVTPLLLIGSPHASVFESRNKLFEGGEGKPVGLLAKLGWSVYGGCPESNDHQYSVQLIQHENEVEEVENRISNNELNDLLCYSNSIDSLGIKSSNDMLTDDEKKAIEIIEEEIRALDDGFIELPLVWNRVNKIIPRVVNNFPMVYKRQLAQETKLLKNEMHYFEYNKNFLELIKDGYVRAATQEDFSHDWPNVLYLPMSLVINKNKEPIKYRNVFDASAKYMGTSLNDNLLKGPDLLIDQIKPLLQMRADSIAFTADVKAMFMRMKINLRDQQCQRVLWRPNVNEDMKVFIVTSMLFGPTCSPFASQYVKNATAQQWEPLYPVAAKLIKENVYMDDILASIADVNEAIEIAKQCIQIFASINLELISFQSNSREFLKSLPCHNVKADAIITLENENLSSTTKVLGCQWDTKQDCFVFKFDKNLFLKIVRECNHHPTKRDQCCSIARIYDIFGFVTPHTIRGKILLQRSWLAGIDWDEPITDEDYKLWKEWVSDIENVAKIKVRRQYCDQKSLSELGEAELHTFCDAGGEAFAAVSYIVTTYRGVRYSNIAMARAKVTPIRFKSKTQISQMPRLEACGCLIAARLTDTITKYLSHIQFKRYLWTDSFVALNWITNPNHKLPKYAIAPIEEILDKTSRHEWRYVPSRINVADKATKFVKIDFSDSQSVWFTGPGFLKCSEQHWPTIKDAPKGQQQNLIEIHDKEKVPINVNNVNYKVEGVASHVLPTLNSLARDYLIDTLSPSIKCRYRKLVRATARALKLYLDAFIPLIQMRKLKDQEAIERIKQEVNLKVLSPKDLERAEHFLIRKAQRESYPDEYEKLQKGLPINNNELRMLMVFMDEESLIRIDSRVNFANYPQRFAPLVPRRSSFTQLLLEQVHYDHNHIHLETQIAFVRSKYWVPQLRAALKSIQSNCNFCSVMRSKPYAPLMAPLPEYRTNPSYLPFENVGMDCLGPITLYCRGIQKKYVLIFVCTLTRFIHLHLLDSLESIRVMEAITVFWSAHGPTKCFISDRGTNFIGAARVLREDKEQMIKFLKTVRDERAQELAEKYSVDWQMIPAHSPWMGGLYERLIKEVKRSIVAVLENRKTNKIQLNIALQDAAHRINCRPLTHNAVDAEDAPILTPHHLAKGRSGFPYLPGMPESSDEQGKRDRDCYHQGRLIADDIMRRFTLYYLPILTKRTKWFDEYRTPIKIGDLVLLIEPNDTRRDWRRARVINLYKGRDGRQRVADVILPDGTVRKARSIQRLAKIEIKSFEPTKPHKSE